MESPHAKNQVELDEFYIILCMTGKNMDHRTISSNSYGRNFHFERSEFLLMLSLKALPIQILLKGFFKKNQRVIGNFPMLLFFVIKILSWSRHIFLVGE